MGITKCIDDFPSRQEGIFTHSRDSLLFALVFIHPPHQSSYRSVINYSVLFGILVIELLPHFPGHLVVLFFGDGLSGIDFGAFHLLDDLFFLVVASHFGPEGVV